MKIRFIFMTCHSTTTHNQQFTSMTRATRRSLSFILSAYSQVVNFSQNKLASLIQYVPPPSPPPSLSQPYPTPPPSPSDQTSLPRPPPPSLHQNPSSPACDKISRSDNKHRRTRLFLPTPTGHTVVVSRCAVGGVSATLIGCLL